MLTMNNKNVIIESVDRNQQNLRKSKFDGKIFQKNINIYLDSLMLKDYLDYYKISQTEFADRLDITQKHMNEILNGKMSITLERAAQIYHLTGIPIEFIINTENRKLVTEYLLKKYGDEKNIQDTIKKHFFISELAKREWVDFKDPTNAIQNYMDLIDFLKVTDLEALNMVQEKTLFKKTGEDINKISLWIARCDELAKSQVVKEYIPVAFNFLIEDLKKHGIEASADEMNFEKTYQIIIKIEK